MRQGSRGILQQKRPKCHDDLLAEISIRPFPRKAQGFNLLGKFLFLLFGFLQILFHDGQGPLTLLKAFVVRLSL